MGETEESQIDLKCMKKVLSTNGQKICQTKVSVLNFSFRFVKSNVQMTQRPNVQFVLFD